VIRQYSRKGYMVFSSSQFEYARIFQLTEPRALNALEDAISRSPRFRIWFENRDTRIYELVS
jgi:hypothetical protein